MYVKVTSDEKFMRCSSCSGEKEFNSYKKTEKSFENLEDKGGR